VQRAAVEDLRRRVERLAAPRRGREALPFGIEEIDRALPGGGLAVGALHEVAGGGDGAVHGAAAALFAAGVAARTRGKVLWCFTRADLFAPSLTQVGLSAARVIYVECGDDKTVLACFEEGLRHQGLGAVVAEVARLSMTASRRLQLAAETSGAIGIAIRRWRRQTEAADFGHPPLDCPLSIVGAIRFSSIRSVTRSTPTRIQAPPCPEAAAAPEGSEDRPDRGDVPTSKDLDPEARKAHQPLGVGSLDEHLIAKMRLQHDSIGSPSSIWVFYLFGSTAETKMVTLPGGAKLATSSAIAFHAGVAATDLKISGLSNHSSVTR